MTVFLIGLTLGLLFYIMLLTVIDDSVDLFKIIVFIVGFSVTYWSLILWI
jgi:hypothetical protein